MWEIGCVSHPTTEYGRCNAIHSHGRGIFLPNFFPVGEGAVRHTHTHTHTHGEEVQGQKRVVERKILRKLFISALAVTV